MAKQRDDHDQPRKKKEEPSDVFPLDDLEIVENESDIVDLADEDLVELEEAPPRSTPPLAKPVTPPASPPPLARPVAPPTAQESPVDPKRTILGKKRSVPTMLAQDSSEGLEEAAPSEPQSREQAPSSGAKKIPDLSLDEPSRSSVHDEDVLDVVEAEPASAVRSDVVVSDLGKGSSSSPPSDVIDILDAEPISGATVKPASAARPSSDIVEITSDVVEAEPASAISPASDVIDFNDIETASEARSKRGSGARSGPKPASDVVDLSSEILEVESASAADKAASDIVEITEAESASEVKEMASDDVLSDEPARKSGQPSSAMFAEEVVEASSDIVEVGEESRAHSPRDLASDVFSAEELETVSDAAKRGEDAIDKSRPRPGEFASDIFSAETVDLEEMPDKGSAAKKRDAEDVLDDIETAGTGSSAVNWDDEDPVSGIRSKTPGKAQSIDDLQETVAFDDDVPRKRTVQTGDDLLTAEDVGEDLLEDAAPRSGVDPVAEALESGVDLGEPASKRLKKKKPDEKTQALAADEVDFDSIESDVEASAVNLGGPPAKKRRVEKEDVTEAATELELAGIEDIEAAEEAEDVEEAAEAEEAEEVAEADEVDADDILSELDADEAAAPKKKGKKSAEEAAEDLLLADDAEAVEADEALEAAEAVDFDDVDDARPARKGKKSKVALLDDDEVLDEDGPPRKKKKKGYDDDEDGGVATLTRKAPKPKYGRRWLGGMLLGILLAVGGAGAVWYFAPDLLEQIPDSPNAKAKDPSADPVKLKADAERLRVELETAEKDKVAQEARAKKAEAALKTAKDTAVTELKTVTAKLDEAAEKLKEAESVVSGVHKALMDEGLIKKDDAPDVKVLTAALVGLGTESREYKQIDKLLKAGDIKEPGSKGLVTLFEAKKAVDEELASIDKLLGEEKLKESGSKGVTELVARKTMLLKDRDSLNGLVLGAFKVLVDAKILNEKDDPRKSLVEGVREARLRGESPLASPLTTLATGMSGLPLGLDKLVAKGIDTVSMAVELEYFRKREPLITGPERNIDLYLVLLQDRTRSAPKDLETPVREANWLLSKEAKSPKDVRGKAHYVLGLTQRNSGKLDQAAKSFALALKEIGEDKDAGLWAELARASHAELTDPNAYYIPRAEKLAAEGNHKKAIEELETALKVMPGNANLLLARGMARLEQGRSAGKVPVEDVAAIRDDATAALKTPETRPMGNFVLGLLEEEQNNIGRAETKLREALDELKKSKEGDTRGQRAMILAALSRVLQQERFDETAPAPKKEIEDKKVDDKKIDEKKEIEKKDVEKKDDTTSRLELQQELLVMLMVGVQADDDTDPETKARLLESIKLAEELIASDNPKIKGQGYILKGKAISKMGDRNEGLRLYVRGVELVNPGKAGADLSKLVEEHPAISYPDSAARPNRYTAEDHFGRGLHHYWFRNYPEAEKSFRQAIYWFRDDARYHYFLGLSLWGQKGDSKEGKKLHADAIYAFQMGSRQEAKGMPSQDDVNVALERIQGPLRQMINEYRLSAVTVPVTEEALPMLPEIAPKKEKK